MAKKARPDPSITDKWVKQLADTADLLEIAHGIVAELEARRGVQVRGAFSEGVLVGALKKATGLSGSRLYQLKFELRDALAKLEAEGIEATPVIDVHDMAALYAAVAELAEHLGLEIAA